MSARVPTSYPVGPAETPRVRRNARPPGAQDNPSAGLSVLIFIVAVGLMSWLRLVVFGDRFITLTYGLPLLICLWHRDRRLLWGMATTFVGMSTYKAFVLLPGHPSPAPALVQLVFQVINILVIATVITLVVNLQRRLRERNRELEAANAEIQAQSEELAQQNEELQQQGEELAQQNEELQEQAEELERQNEELQRQGEELQAMNEEMDRRGKVLELIMALLPRPGPPRGVLTQIAQALPGLMGGAAETGAILLKEGTELVVHEAGGVTLGRERWPLAGSFAGLVMEQGRTAFIEDRKQRPDLQVAGANDERFRSVLATPLYVREGLAGVLKVYSKEPRLWTVEHFRLLEWTAAQVSLVLETLESQERLEALVQQRTAKLQEAMGELETFSYSMAHDMRTPLRAMVSFANLLQAEHGPELSDTARGYIERIAAAATRMHALVRDVLTYSQITRGDLALEPVPLGPLIDAVREQYSILKDASLRVNGELPVVLGHGAALTQVFSNLLVNAAKFVPPGRVPEIEIEAVDGAHRAPGETVPGKEESGGTPSGNGGNGGNGQAQPSVAAATSTDGGAQSNGDAKARHATADDWVTIWVRDKGIGIAPEYHDRVFRMFERLHATGHYEGTGIGLAVVRRAVQRMGGTAGVESTEGNGSRFWITLRRPQRATTGAPLQRM